jgi:hypothetical protein
MATPPYPKNVAKRRRLTAIDGRHRFMTVEDGIVHPQGKQPHTKLIYLQKLCFEADNRLE